MTPDTLALEEEIATLAGQIAATTWRLLDCVRRFDESEAWAKQGFRSCAHWLSWRIGLNVGAAREKVRVARALAELPRICAALQNGSVSYAKVRALTRIATPQSEANLLNIALAGTASHVERVVRAYRRNEKLALAQANQQHDRRSLHTFWDEDGMLVIGGRLPPEAGAALLCALDACEDVSAETPAEARRADALARTCERALASGAHNRDAYQVVVHVDADVLAQPEAEGHAEVQHGPALSAHSARRLACSGSRLVMHHDGSGQLLDIGRKTRTVSTPLLRALRERDRTCRFPGCGNTRFVDAHHIEHWADGGPTNLHNLVLLCSACHRRVHEGGFHVAHSKEGLVFIDPQGHRLKDAPAMPPAATEPPLPRAPMPTWGGERLDLDWVLASLAIEPRQASTSAREGAHGSPAPHASARKL